MKYPKHSAERSVLTAMREFGAWMRQGMISANPSPVDPRKGNGKRRAS